MEPVEDSLTKGRVIFPEEVNRYVLEKRKGGKEEGKKEEGSRGEGRAEEESVANSRLCFV